MALLNLSGLFNFCKKIVYFVEHNLKNLPPLMKASLIVLLRRCVCVRVYAWLVGGGIDLKGPMLVSLTFAILGQGALQSTSRNVWP